MYTFEKTGEIRLNNRNVNVYDVYQTETKEQSDIIETCERPGVTVVTSRAKFIKCNTNIDSKIFVGRVYGKTAQEARDMFFAE
jgi:hypothetical protein